MANLEAWADVTLVTVLGRYSWKIWQPALSCVKCATELFGESDAQALPTARLPTSPVEGDPFLASGW